jgi:G3E family GTPase
MLLDCLIPRSFSPETENEGVTLLHNLLMQLHLDRKVARRIGWRGFLPSNKGNFSWSTRLANSDLVYGIVFMGEEHDDQAIASAFDLYAFPVEDEIKSQMPESMQTLYEKDGHIQKIRALSEHFPELQEFKVGSMGIAFRLDKAGLNLSFHTYKRDLRFEGRTMRPARVLMPLFAALVHSFQTSLEAAPLLQALKSRELPSTNDFFIEADFGSTVFEDDETGTGSYALPNPPLSYKPDEVDMSDKPLIHVLCGFLGSGKTTFLQNWLNFLHTRERFTGVLQNEFGEIDLDTALIGDETCVEALNDGCVCCSLADSLRPGILRLIQNTPADQMILETTGLANPDNVVHSLEELGDICKIGLVVSVADAPNLIEHPEYLIEKLRLAQLNRADVIVISKADLVSSEKIDKLARELHDMNQKALIILSANGDANFAVLDHFFNHWIDKKYGMFTSRKHTPGTDTMLLNNAGFAMRGNASLFETCALKFSEPVELERIEPIIRNSGRKILRAKGIVDVLGKGCCEVQYTDGMLTVSQAREDLQACERWLTIIGKGLKPQTGATTIRKSRCL